MLGFPSKADMLARVKEFTDSLRLNCLERQKEAFSFWDEADVALDEIESKIKDAAMAGQNPLDAVLPAERRYATEQARKGNVCAGAGLALQNLADVIDGLVARALGE